MINMLSWLYTFCMSFDSVRRKEQLATGINTVICFTLFTFTFAMQYRPPIGHQNLHRHASLFIR